MADVSRFLREGHQNLAKQLERLVDVAESIGEASRDLLQRNVDHVYEMLIRRLLPHALAEEQELYPLIGKILGTPQATTTMSCDHAAISRLVAELDGLRSDLHRSGPIADNAHPLRRVLYSLHALIGHHLAKEEEVYLPLLDIGLTEDEAHQLRHRMQEVEDKVAGSDHD